MIKQDAEKIHELIRRIDYAGSFLSGVASSSSFSEVKDQVEDLRTATKELLEIVDRLYPDEVEWKPGTWAIYTPDPDPHPHPEPIPCVVDGSAPAFPRVVRIWIKTNKVDRNLTALWVPVSCLEPGPFLRPPWATRMIRQILGNEVEATEQTIQPNREEQERMNRENLIQRLTELPSEIADHELLILDYQTDVLNRKNVLKIEEASLVLSGKIEGKNQSERDLDLFRKTLPQRGEIQTAERRLDGCQLELRELQNEFSALRSIARLLGPEKD